MSEVITNDILCSFRFPRGSMSDYMSTTECKYGVKGCQLGSSPGIGLVVSGCFDVDTPFMLYLFAVLQVY